MRLAVLVLAAVGCKDQPGTRQQQGAVIGGASGAAVGAAAGGEKHRVLGPLLGGALGATGGYVIGAETDKIRTTNRTAAVQANNGALSRPATVQDVSKATTADLNGDGFVTLDEVVALSAAGLPDKEILQRLQATRQVFELTDEQKRYLIDHGVNATIVDQMMDINSNLRQQVLHSQAISSGQGTR